MGKEPENPIKKVYGGVILGNQGFVRKVLWQLRSDRIEKMEVSHRKALHAAAGVEQIIEAVLRHYRISLEEIAGNKSSESQERVHISFKEPYRRLKRRDWRNIRKVNIFGDQNKPKFFKTYGTWHGIDEKSREYPCRIFRGCRNFILISLPISIFKGNPFSSDHRDPRSLIWHT